MRCVKFKYNIFIGANTVKNNLFRNRLFIKKSSIQGYGVFAEKDIAAGEIIEECHTIATEAVCPKLNNYYFNSGDEKLSILALGFGSIYNHSVQPNAEYVFDRNTSLLIIKASHSIKAGEEIFISYGAEWFSSRQMKIKPLPLRKRLQKQLSHPLPVMIIKFAVLLGAYFVLLKILHA